MAATNLGGIPLIILGSGGFPGYGTIMSGTATATLDAANEAISFIGHVYWEDAASHTVDTTGSSSLQWRSNSATFANAGTTLVVGLGDVDTGSATARAVNASDVITMDVSRSLTGGGGGVANGGWNTTVPTSGTKTIAHGALVAFSVQMTARGGADAVQPAYANHQSGSAAYRPTVSTFLGGSYAIGGGLPNCAIVASDGTLGFFYGGACFSTTATVAFNSGSSPNERGNAITIPVPGKAIGIAYSFAIASNAADVDLVLYSDPFGTPVAQKTISLDANTLGATTGNLYGAAMFSSPYTFTASQQLAVVIKPTTANNVTPTYITLGSSSLMKAYSLGTGAYAINRSSGAFSVQNSNLERYGIGLIVDAFDNGVGSGGGGQRVFGG